MLRFFKTEHELCNEFAQARATGRLPYKCNGNERERLFDIRFISTDQIIDWLKCEFTFGANCSFIARNSPAFDCSRQINNLLTVQCYQTSVKK